MAQIKGKQLADAPDGVSNSKINDGAVNKIKTDAEILSADGLRPLTGDWSIAGFKITALGTPTVASDAVTKAYADALAAGLSPKASCRVKAQGDIVLAAPGAMIDGIALVAGDRFLADLQAVGTEDGIYVWNGAAVPATRSTDMPAGSSASGAYTFIKQGTNADQGWVCVTDPPADIVGVDPLVFSQFSGAGTYNAGIGLNEAPANTFNVDYGLVGDIVAEAIGSVASAGVLDLAARADHRHEMPAAAVPVNVGIANAEGVALTFARSDHVHDSPAPVTADKNLVASVTAVDNDLATVSTVSAANALAGYVGVRVNGVHNLVGDGTKIGVDCYFSGDAGVTARAMSAIVAGDTLRWNGTVAGFQLAGTDRIDFDYSAF